MSDTRLIPSNDYLSITAGQTGYDGTTEITMPSGPDYHTVSGIYTTSDTPSSVFQLNATKFDQAQAVSWYYNIQGYKWKNKQLTFPFGMESKMSQLYRNLEASTDDSLYRAFVNGNSDPPNEDLLWGIAPFFGKSTQEPSSFRYAAMTSSTLFGLNLGALTLSIASEVIPNSDITISNPTPTTTVTYSSGEKEQFQVDFNTGARTRTFTALDGEEIVTIEPNFAPTNYTAISYLLTYPVEERTYFYDAYGKFSGFYGSEQQFNAAVASENATSIDTYEVTPLAYPSAFLRNLSFGGAQYYQFYDSLLPNFNSHRIVG